MFTPIASYIVDYHIKKIPIENIADIQDIKIALEILLIKNSIEKSTPEPIKKRIILIKELIDHPENYELTREHQKMFKSCVMRSVCQKMVQLRNMNVERKQDYLKSLAETKANLPMESYKKMMLNPGMQAQLREMPWTFEGWKVKNPHGTRKVWLESHDRKIHLNSLPIFKAAMENKIDRLSGKQREAVCDSIEQRHHDTFKLMMDTMTQRFFTSHLEENFQPEDLILETISNIFDSINYEEIEDFHVVEKYLTAFYNNDDTFFIPIKEHLKIKIKKITDFINEKNEWKDLTLGFIEDIICDLHNMTIEKKQKYINYLNFQK